MLKKSLLLLPALFPALAAFSQGHNIHLSLKPFANSQVYLGYHYGKVKAVADSITLNANAEGDFKGKESLQEGVYFIVSPQKEILFELRSAGSSISPFPPIPAACRKALSLQALRKIKLSRNTRSS
jgi:hypothetical protein